MELPRVYVNPIDKKFDNVQSIYDGKVLDRSKESEVSLSTKINNIFSSKDFVYKKRVRITTINGKEEKIIVGKTNDALLTLNGEKIKINDIYDIEII